VRLFRVDFADPSPLNSALPPPPPAPGSRYLGLLRRKFIETAQNYLVEMKDSADSKSSASTYLGSVYINIMFTEVPPPPLRRAYSWKPSPLTIQFLLNFSVFQMAARVGKNIVRALLREKMRELKVPSSEPYRQLVLHLFNLFSGHHPLATKFWTATSPSNRILKISSQRSRTKVPLLPLHHKPLHMTSSDLSFCSLPNPV